MLTINQSSPRPSSIVNEHNTALSDATRRIHEVTHIVSTTAEDMIGPDVPEGPKTAKLNELNTVPANTIAHTNELTEAIAKLERAVRRFMP